MLTVEEKQGLQRSICEDCSLQVNWLQGDCEHAENCHAQLTVLMGIGNKIVDCFDISEDGK